MQQKSNLKYLNPLIAICIIFGIVPHQTNNIFYQFYKKLLVVLHIIGHLWMFSVKFTPLYPDLDVFVMSSEQISLTTILFVSLSTIICSTIYKPEKFQKLLDLFDTFDKHNGFDPPSRKIFLWISILFIHIKTVLVIKLDAISWGNSAIAVIMNRYYFTRHIQMYAMELTNALGNFFVKNTLLFFVVSR